MTLRLVLIQYPLQLPYSDSTLKKTKFNWRAKTKTYENSNEKSSYNEILDDGAQTLKYIAA